MKKLFVKKLLVMVYEDYLKDLLKNAIDNPNSEVDEFIVAEVDRIVQYVVDNM